MSLSCEQTGRADLVVRDDGGPVAEIRSLRMVMACFRPGGDSFLGPDVPLALYWMQYANHEDPERNAGSHTTLQLVSSSSHDIVLRCVGSTASGAAVSESLLVIYRTEHPVRYHYRISTCLEVVSPSGWTVTRNPHHGEVEFANLWPRDSFTTRQGIRKLYQACYLVGPTGASRIPHHHMESSDKHRIAMEPGDRFIWGVEEENPCMKIESGGTVSAGVCAYMWDAHFAYEATGGTSSVVLPRGTVFRSGFSLSGLSRSEVQNLVAGARDRPAGEHGPLYVEGINRFSESIDTPGVEVENAWPWETEGDAEFSLDNSRGYDDAFSLRIRPHVRGRGMWRASALGPAYGRPPYRDGVRFRFRAFALTEDFQGKVSVGLRLHREGRENLFDFTTYELYTSEGPGGPFPAWTCLEAATPPIVPAPDRLHLLLMCEGRGTVWFDNAQLEVL